MACRGRVCDDCGACILRSDWLGWPCTTKGCGRYYSVKTSSGTIDIIKARVINNLGRDLGIAVNEPMIQHFPVANSIGGYRIRKYIIPGTNSYMLHLAAMSQPILEPGGANEMFETLQKDNLGLVRQVMTTSFGKFRGEQLWYAQTNSLQGRGEGRTNHYTTNYVSQSFRTWIQR
jgi:hypothetical protein